MIKQTTTLPVVPSDPESPGGHQWQRWAFIVAELVLLGSIPVLAILGFRSLLDSRAGEFAVEPGPDDPGWLALVDPTPIRAMVDVDDGRVAGMVLVVPSGEEATGGAVVLVPGVTEVGGAALATRSPADAVEALGQELRLVIDAPLVLDSKGWVALLGGQEVELANPDPVPGDDGTVVVPAGRIVIEPSLLAPMSTRLPPGVVDPEALEFRRSIIWRTLLDVVDFSSEAASTATDGSERVGADEAAEARGATARSEQQISLVDRMRADLHSISSGVHRVEPLPLDGRAVDLEAAEALMRSIVALPTGPGPGTRLQVRIIDRAGTNDLAAAATNLGQAGFEVVQIANSIAFDDGPTQLLVAPGSDLDEVARLAGLTGADTVPPGDDPEAVSTVTLLLGDGARIALPS